MILAERSVASLISRWQHPDGSLLLGGEAGPLMRRPNPLGLLLSRPAAVDVSWPFIRGLRPSARGSVMNEGRGENMKEERKDSKHIVCADVMKAGAAEKWLTVKKSALGSTHSSTHASLLISDSSLNSFVPFLLEVNLVPSPRVFSLMISNRDHASN